MLGRTAAGPLVAFYGASALPGAGAPPPRTRSQGSTDASDDRSERDDPPAFLSALGREPGRPSRDNRGRGSRPSRSPTVAGGQALRAGPGHPSFAAESWA